MKLLHQLGEPALIERLKRRLPQGRGVLVGIGDDCAVIQSSASFLLLLKTDAVVEGVHFDATAKPRQVGWKAMARALSDIAAMAGTPRWALVTVGLREDMPVSFVEALYRGLSDAAQEFGACIVGGETVRTEGPFWLSVALAGEVNRKRLCRRNSAKVGDAILVTGALGGSIAGKHLSFMPRVREAQWLAQRRVHAMIDISDGLSRDLDHICRASGVGARLDATAIPIARAASSSLERAVNDGEDFELLFTMPPTASQQLLTHWRRKFPRLRLTRIGMITRQRGVRVVDEEGNESLLKAAGYDHFVRRK